MSIRDPQILRYTRWLAAERGLQFDPTTYEGYDALWRWSVTDLRGFWLSVWDYFEIQSPTPFETGSIRPSVALAAIAASTALPPFFNTSMPT